MLYQAKGGRLDFCLEKLCLNPGELAEGFEQEFKRWESLTRLGHEHGLCVGVLVAQGPPRWHVGQPCGKASRESLVGNPRGKSTDTLIQANGSATLLLQLGRKAHVNSRGKVHRPVTGEQ